jgi:hypothetical protein
MCPDEQLVQSPIIEASGGTALGIEADVRDRSFRLARIEAKLLVRLTEQGVPGAFYVIGGKGLAVVPLDPLVQSEQLSFGRIPGPFYR